MRTFHPIEGGVTPEYCQRLAEQHRVPTAICVLGAIEQPDHVLTIKHSQGLHKIVPTLSFDRYPATPAGTSIENYVAHRIVERMGVIAADQTLSVLPSEFMSDYELRGTQTEPFPYAIYHTYVPVIGKISRIDHDHPRHQKLQPALLPAAEVINMYEARYQNGNQHVSVLKACLDVLRLYNWRQQHSNS
jgi:hypothetical protein